MPNSMTFSIAEAAEDTTAGTITSWGAGSPGADSASFAPLVSQAGTLWWAISARGQGNSDQTDGVCKTLDDIKANAAPLNATTPTEAQTANADKIKTDYANTETDPNDGETWAEFQQRKYTAHLGDTYYGVENIYSASVAASISATWLWADTPYQICGYVENIYGSVSSYTATGTTYDIEYFATTAMDSNWSWSIAGQGTASMASISTTTIRDSVSY